jgi:hypothetical protein
MRRVIVSEAIVMKIVVSLPVAILAALIIGCASMQDPNIYVQSGASNEKVQRDYAECQHLPTEEDDQNIAMAVFYGLMALTPSARIAGCMAGKGYQMRSAWYCDNGGQWDEEARECIGASTPEPTPEQVTKAMAETQSQCTRLNGDWDVPTSSCW